MDIGTYDSNKDELNLNQHLLGLDPYLHDEIEEDERFPIKWYYDQDDADAEGDESDNEFSIGDLQKEARDE